ncbi:ABC transporter permease [Marinobacter shengliensis]|uniref:ABC transporter permease n=1 Tax=Marinobacter shengliensis TaxID=1389223 RepID=UPI001E5477DE|nr:ABC transporter permease [Marinobacter shengliensis]MCD1630886.1 ABC transporter permease [Marinobacter shengliensis]
MGIALFGLLRKELVQFFRDRLILTLILWLYTIEVVICAVALSFDVSHLPLAVVDEDRSALSRSLIQKFAVSETFDLKFQETRVATATDLLEKGDATMVLVVPAGFEGALLAGKSAQLQLLQDGTNSNIAANAVNDALQIVQRQEREALPAAGKKGVAVPLIRIWYNPDLTTSGFIVLSMIALAGMMVGVIHPAASIVREKERGTIEQLLVTPISTLELFLAKVTPTLIMGVLSIFPSLVIVRVFDVPLQGSLLLFLVLTAIFLLSAIALGVLIAAYSRTLQQALLLSFFGLFPLMFLSGSLTPVEAMPPFLQSLSLLSPLRYYMDIIVGIFLKGAGLAVLWDEALALLVIGVSLFIFSLWVFRRRVQ